VNQQLISARGLHLSWWELNLNACVASTTYRLAAYRKMRADGYVGLVLSHLSRFEMKKADRLTAEYGGSFLNAEMNTEFHQTLGNYSSICKEYFFKSEHHMRTFASTMMERPRTVAIAKNDINIRIAHPTVQHALININFKLFSGDSGMALTLEDGPHVSEIKVLLTLCSAGTQ